MMFMHAITLINYGQLPAVELQTGDGARAIVTLFGAHVVAWNTADGVQRLFCSKQSATDGKRAIRGGIPIIFPQFSTRGDGMRHGFARISEWRLEDKGGTRNMTFAEFSLSDADLADDIARRRYPFELRFKVTLQADTLSLSFKVNNTGKLPFSFSSALHSYWAVHDLEKMTIDGLQKTRFSDYTTDLMQSGVQSEATLRCRDKIDRIYHHIGGDVHLYDGTRQLHLQQQGFADAVVWNPGAADAAALSDLADDEFQRFICIEAALIDPYLLAPGAQWQGSHRISNSAKPPAV